MKIKTTKIKKEWRESQGLGVLIQFTQKEKPLDLEIRPKQEHVKEDQEKNIEHHTNHNISQETIINKKQFLIAEDGVGQGRT